MGFNRLKRDIRVMEPQPALLDRVRLAPIFHPGSSFIGGELASTEDGRRMARAVVGHQAT